MEQAQVVQQLQNELIHTKARAFDRLAILEDQMQQSNNVLREQSDLIKSIVETIGIPEEKKNDAAEILAAVTILSQVVAKQA